MLNQVYKVILALVMITTFTTSTGFTINTDVNLNLQNGENWKYTVDLWVSQQDEPLMQTGIERMIGAETIRARSAGVTLVTDQKTENGFVHHIFTFSGTGYDALTKTTENGSVTKQGNDQVVISIPPPNTTLGESDFTLSVAGKIVSSNATSVDGNTAHWTSKKSTTIIQATVTPGVSGFAWGWLFAWGLILLLLIGGAAVLLYFRREQIMAIAGRFVPAPAQYVPPVIVESSVMQQEEREEVKA